MLLTNEPTFQQKLEFARRFYLLISRIPGICFAEKTILVVNKKVPSTQEVSLMVAVSCEFAREEVALGQSEVAPFVKCRVRRLTISRDSLRPQKDWNPNGDGLASASGKLAPEQGAFLKAFDAMCIRCSSTLLYDCPRAI